MTLLGRIVSALCFGAYLGSCAFAPIAGPSTASLSPRDCSVERAADEYDAALTELSLRVGHSGPALCRWRISGTDASEAAHSLRIGDPPLASCRRQWSNLLRAARNDSFLLRRVEIAVRIERYAYAGRDDELTRTIMLAKARRALGDLMAVHRASREDIQRRLRAEMNRHVTDGCLPVVEESWRRVERLRQELAGVTAAEWANERVLVNEIAAMKANIKVMRQLSPRIVARQKTDIAEREQELARYRQYLATSASR